ncbi:7TM diverse intracellular signaling domain-containing protein [Pseudomonas sp. MH10]|uniref:sensor histidine kinase n=1 Tax=Pseudomonas sp. MH10 TaxID=3048627 RepID=UPI002AC9C775|nr:7TM diverse intracellular signaling domain-containing protein [Pseudomonas sp. MH10]MEB0043201.1 7TM diverse intracellular signaling domain-containing protein [Pseudomonas sp. MH10]WPX63225.1 7TM diverse intracellular signaling domain-containing protein [Pseudomonas sp. MH10]
MRYLLIMLVAWLPLLAGAVEFDETTRTLPLGRAVQVFEDVTGDATIEEVSDPTLQGRFRDLNAEALNAGYSRSAYWLKVDLQFRPEHLDARPDWLLEMAYPPMDHVDLYTADASGRFRLAWQTGDMLPFSSRQIKQNNFLFDLNLPPDEVKTLYVRVAGHGSIQAPLALWSSHAYIEAQPARIYVLGLIYGMLVGMLIYNLFIYIGVRDTSYLYYILYIASFGLYQISVNGAGIEFFWPNNPWWANASTPFLVGSAVFFASQFSRHFLQTPSLNRWLDRSLKLLMAFAAVVMVLSVTMDYGVALRLATGLVLLFTLVIVATGITAKVRGLRVARYYIVAWSVFLSGGLINAFMLMGYLPNNFLTMYSSQIGSVLEVALLSLALADRINMMREQQAQILFEAGQKLERLNQKLETSNRLKDEFLATLTHELRTPMNGVIGSLELMQMMPMDSEFQLYQQTAANSAQDMMGMVNGILTLTELQAGKLYAVNEPFSLRWLVAELRRQYVSEAQAKHLSFFIELDEALPDSLLGDVSKLQQCIGCLLDNAIKFTKTGSVSVRITGKSDYLQTHTVLIEVIDSGIGFGRLDEAALYQTFFQVDGSMTREYGGLGIGLAICRQLIGLMGGTLSHQSEPGRGSCFTLRVELGHSDVEPQRWSSATHTL